jgi:glycosyltransferase involved in cell wall biosynthesis
LRAKQHRTEPYLSVVVTKPSDSQPGYVNRIRRFAIRLRAQCLRLRIPAELIIVEWVGAQDPEPLSEKLHIPNVPGPCAVRLVELEARKKVDPAIGQSIGMSRAQGRYVLSTEIHVDLSDELMEFIGGQYARYSSLEPNDIAAKDGSLMLGKGWFWKEMDGSKPFRWFNNYAEISIQPFNDSARVLAIDIEPGPGVGKGPTTLDVLDDRDATVVSVQLERRRVVNIPVPPHPGTAIRLRLRVSGGGHRLPRDPRPLNARVLRCGLYEAPVAAVSWSIPKRIFWMLTQTAGSSLLPELTHTEKWPDSPHLAAARDFTIVSREAWLCSASALDENWKLRIEGLRETLLIERVIIDVPRRVPLDLLWLPLAWFFRLFPRPPMPEPGAFPTAFVEADPPARLANPPKISIVTPSYQQGRFLEWTMRSVLEQGYPNLEYVVMDGGSKDQTTDILERYQDCLHYCESSPDEGQADAVARGFEHTSGEIMAYLNSDDLLAPGALDFVARYFAEHPEVDAVYSHRVFIDEQNIVTRYWVLPPHHSWMMERWDYIPQETCFWRRRIYDDVGGIDKSFQFALDYDLFVRFMKVGRMERVNRFLGAFREHLSSKTTNQEGMHPEVLRVYKEKGIHIADWQRLPQLAQHELLDIRSRKHAASGKRLPGALPGIGYDYDLVWGGRLNALRSSSRSSSGTRRI